jgi:hypothetical protein
MLYTLEGKEIVKVPHPETWKLIKLRLLEEELGAINEAITEVLDNCNWTVSGWVPGKVWNGTVYQPIFDKGAKGDYDLAAKMYGLLFWVAVMEHDVKWTFVEDRTGSKRYFRIGEKLKEGPMEEKAFPHSRYSSQVGMPLRDYFAIRYAVTLVRNIELESFSPNSHRQVAKESYKFADIMLEERKK